jgi:gluconolactonase
MVDERLFPPRVPAVRDASTELRVLAGGIDHPECVAWFDGRVWCGTESGDLLAIDPASRTVEVAAHVGGFVCGFAFDRSGRCWVCDIGGGRLVILRRDLSIERVIDTVSGVRLHTPNYPAIARDGSVWVADSGSGWDADDGFLFHVAADGGAEIVDRECVRFPNGIALSEAEDALYLVESRLPGVVVYPLVGGRPGSRRELLRMPGTVPDGLAFDAAGSLYIACWRPDRVYRLPAGGELEVFLDDCTAEYLNSPTNVCFGGSDGRRLYLAGLCGWAITEIDVETPGRILPT